MDTDRMPTLATERLTLRPFRDDDAATVERIAGDRRIAETTATIPHPYPKGAAAEWIATHEASWHLGKGLVLAMSDRESGRLVGAIGLTLQSEHKSAEMGYWIGHRDWNRGYCTEAARAIVDYGFGTLDLHRIYAHHFARNVASGRVLEKVGMRHEGVLRDAFLKWGRFEDIRQLSILRDEWERTRA